MRTVRLKVRLRDVEPPVERVVDVPAALTLPELHQVLQAAMGWVNVHLHAFEGAGGRYSTPDEDKPDDELYETSVPMRVLGERFSYEYDFGDGWVHDVELLGSGGDEPGCVDGSGSCPLEDCGGPHGYERLRAALADPGHPDHDDMLRWTAGGVPEFDLAATDRLVRHVVGSVPPGVRLLLEVLDDGVELTPGGRLPRKVVRAIQEHRPEWAFSEKPASIEEDLMPLAALHDVLRQAKVLRVRRGVVAPIKAASDDLEVLRRLRSWFGPDGGFLDRLAVMVVAVVLSGSPVEEDELARRVADMLGDRWMIGGHPLTVADVDHEIGRLVPVLEGLDQVVVDRRRWSAGAAAADLLPTAAVMAAAMGEGSTQPHYR
ncbi:plasmid pRiA4b ORF-3 family protein [Actinomycetospora termitidis]|uniref:Plasmid pRiA4b ORF-3 family protein n=1 Tax=Actinomycetospora termitidis TaxID=3053470 RepID=A0ABT7MEF1_9PSEU|nr:plasmid pRiA4b ORF-3 family protein [Actinomycetospora sp. Odt1-22]MDL5159036.1 plasmid pRiA4b ORF-3 family protein [Actinomycetospora sp. Odt1-22]